MLLRASSTALGVDADPRATVGDDVDSGVEHGALLETYAAAAHHDGDDLAAAESALRAAVGEAGFVEAAMTVAVFNGLVRTADASGIPLDERVLSATVDDREALGLNDFGGATNSELAVAGGAIPAPGLFG